MRRPLLLLLLMAAGLLAYGRPAPAQAPSYPLEAYVKPRLGLTQYTGENSPSLFTGPCGGSTLGCPRSSYGIGLEAGLYVSPQVGASLAYQTASYSSIADVNAAPAYARDYRTRTTMQLLTEYRFPDLSSYVTPYVQAGMHVTSGHTPLRTEHPDPQRSVQIVERWAFGPSFTAGLDVSVGRHLAVFAEVATNVALPDDALDGHGGFIGMDRLSWAGLGVKLQRLPLSARLGLPHSPAQAPSTTGSTATAPSALAVHEMGRFELTPESPSEASSGRFRWTFSDGTVREGHIVTKQFATPGTYRADVHATDDEAPLHTFRVRVHPAPAPLRIESIRATPDTLQPGDSIVFEPVLQSGTPVEYRWAFGDGTTAFTRAPIYAYSEAGTYKVTLEVLSTAGRAAHTRRVIVGPDTDTTLRPTRPYRVQLGAFSTAARADRFARRHAARLPKPPIVQHDVQTGYHRVELAYARAPDARAALRSVRRTASFADAFLRATGAGPIEMASQTGWR